MAIIKNSVTVISPTVRYGTLPPLNFQGKDGDIFLVIESEE